MDPDCFADGFARRMQKFMDENRELDPIDSSLPVRIPGDFAKSHKTLVEKVGGLVYHKSQIKYLHDIAQEHAVDFFEMSTFVTPKM